MRKMFIFVVILGFSTPIYVSAELFKHRDAGIAEKLDFRINASGLWHAKIGFIERFNDYGVDVENQIPKLIDFGITGKVDVASETCQWTVKIFPEPNMSNNEMFGGLVKCRNKKTFKFIAWKDGVADAYFPVKNGVMKISYTKRPNYKNNNNSGENW
ncbi:hypothetical protein [Endozoicomonas atrinae]|uniref:hypothetical protein n=1 Tax=Endozoicomonas atrinae TaxID=1333660 RepID=UPI000824079F|nr:hypothetical protein [Endozoicomonas atrinae]